MEQRRKYFRVDATIFLEVRLLSQREAETSRSRLTGVEGPDAGLSLPPDVKDPHLNEWLRFINNKLDRLLKLHSGGGGFSPLGEKRVNISAGGINFPSPVTYPLGDSVEIKMILPTQPPLHMVVVGEILRIENRNDGYCVAARFINIDEDVRQKIADFVLFREREIMMSKRR